jgi:hypothetical protein
MFRLYENYTVADRQRFIEARDKAEQEQIQGIVTEGLKCASKQ